MLSEELVDIAARHQVYLERLKQGEIQKTDVLFARLDRDLADLLFRIREEDLGQLASAQAALLLEDIRKRQTDAYQQHMAALITTLYDLHLFEREFELEALNEVTAEDVTVTEEEDPTLPLWLRVQNAVTQGTGKILAAYLGAWVAHEVGRAEDLTRIAISQGWSPQRLLQAFRGTKVQRYGNGLFASARHNTATTIRTAVQHVSTVTRTAVADTVVLEKNERAGKFKLPGYRWVSILDSRTSQICRSLDGRLFPFGKGPLPPAHPRCRSTVVSEIAKRFLKNADDTRPATGAQGAEKVDASTTYYEWLKRQPEAFQNDALGVTRATLFRKGGLSAEQFAKLNLDRNFAPLTLEEMRKLAPRAFKRAGI